MKIKRYEKLIRDTEAAVQRGDKELAMHQLDRLKRFFKEMEEPLNKVNFMYEKLL
jgi:hypothetical protein